MEPAPWETDGEDEDRSTSPGSPRPLLSGVGKKLPPPMSEKLRVLRSMMPDMDAMRVGDEGFVPTFGYTPEEAVVRAAIRRSRRTRRDVVIFSLPEWRAHIRGRYIVCVHPTLAPNWEALHTQLKRSLMLNRKEPPLSKHGNAFVPRLQVHP
jgi:hypothetical protein